jgi:hypothetical protein
MSATTTTAAVPCSQCGRRHRSWLAVAKCRWPRAEWVCGDPPFDGPAFASVSLCGGEGQTTVILYPTEAEARGAKRLIDRLACGGRCCRLHSVVELSRDGGRVPA